jgi:hypothetical protein
MPISYGSQTNVTGNSLAISIFSSLDPTFLSVEYPERLWKKVIGKQINSGVNAGAQNHVHLVKDRHGAAAFMSPVRGANIPRVGVSMGAITVPLAVSAVGADITNEDARQYEFGNLGSLPQDLQVAMQDACENLIEAAFFFGDSSVNFNSFMAYTGVTVITVANNAGATSKLWTAKTALEIWADINTGIAYMYNASNTLFIPDTLYLPPSKFILLQQPMTIGGVAIGMSIQKYLEQNNAAVALGGTFKIEPIRYLVNAGSTGIIDRGIFVHHDKKYQEMAFPLPYTMQAPVPIPLGATMVAEQKFGSFACYQPASMLYMDAF